MLNLNRQRLAIAPIGFGILLSLLGTSLPAETSPFQLAQSSQRDDVIIDGGGNTGGNTGGTTQPGSDVTQSSRFECQQIGGQYTVAYYPKSQPNQAYPWVAPRPLGGGWTSERRCAEISRRLEMYRPDGLLEMRTAMENNYNIVCVTTEKNPACQIVLTVPPGEDPEFIRDRTFSNITLADGGSMTQPVNSFLGNNQDFLNLNNILNGISGSSVNRNTSRARGVNLRPYLDPSDGGSGSRLTGGITQNRAPRNIPNNSRPGRRLNPDNFR